MVNSHDLLLIGQLFSTISCIFILICCCVASAAVAVFLVVMAYRAIKGTI